MIYNVQKGFWVSVSFFSKLQNSWSIEDWGRLYLGLVYWVKASLPEPGFCKYMLQFETNTSCNLTQIRLAIKYEYILLFKTNTFSNLRRKHFTIWNREGSLLSGFSVLGEGTSWAGFCTDGVRCEIYPPLSSLELLSEYLNNQNIHPKYLSKLFIHHSPPWIYCQNIWARHRQPKYLSVSYIWMFKGGHKYSNVWTSYLLE